MQLEEDNERSKLAIQPPEPTDLKIARGLLRFHLATIM